ncbi:Succinate dehydrogenase iron-sulfur subunit 2 [Diplonema papillatum]|nr:Succinate dehydrogenase iron-sulfur subunit 2 [Diplonema papillatum]
MMRGTRRLLSEVAKEVAAAPAINVEGTLQIARFDPATNTQRIDSFKYPKKNEYMVLDLLVAVKAHQDPSLAFRASCCEGVCGSCAMNINGINSLACITYATQHTTVFPLPNFPVLKDLVVDLKNYFRQYEFIRPYTRNHNKHRFHIHNIYSDYKKATTALYGQNTLSAAPVSDTRRWSGLNTPTKKSAYFSLLDKCVSKGDKAGAMKVLEAMNENGVKLSKNESDKVVKALSA